MNENNEDDLSFLGKNFFMLPLYASLDGESCEKNCEEKNKAKLIGFNIFRMFDGSWFCFLPSNDDF